MFIENKLIDTIERITKIGFHLSNNFAKESTDNIQMKLSSIFLAKAIPNSISILKLIPGSSFSKAKIQDDFYDFTSIGSLCRNFIELSNQHFYYCLEKGLTEQEIDFRIILYNFHEAKELMAIVRNYKDSNDTRMVYLENKIQEFKIQLQNNSYFQTLDEKLKKNLKRGKNNMHMGHSDIIELRNDSIKEYRYMYKLLSNYTHTSPLSLNHVVSKMHNAPKNLPVTTLELILEYYISNFNEFLISINNEWGINFKSKDDKNYLEDIIIT